MWRLFVAGFGMMQVMMYAIPAYIADAGTMSADIEQLMRWASLLLTLPVVLYSAGTILPQCWRDLRLRRCRHGCTGGTGRGQRIRGKRMGDGYGER